MHDMRVFVDRALAIVESHDVGAGGYARWAWQDPFDSRALGINEYGCADAINILYTLNALPEATRRAALAEALHGLQDSATGLFREATHDPLHTTAHCVAALELLDEAPRHPLSGLAPINTSRGIVELLEGLDWQGNPWTESHKGAGAYAALVVAGEASSAWQDAYFEWLWEEADPATGLWRKGAIEAGGDERLFHHLAGSFHYLFNHESARRPLRYPDRMVDTCLRIYRQGLFEWLCKMVGFSEVDWVYCLNRALRQSGHRFDEARAALRDFAAEYVAFLGSLDPATDEGLNDLHQLFGALCALAELQQALPGELCTERPLRLVLDRRPFI